MADATQKPMTQKITMKSVLLITAGFALAAAARAQSAATNPTAPASPPAQPTEISRGLLGQTYSGLTYTYTELRHSPLEGQGLRFEYNMPLNLGFDAKFTYDGLRTTSFANLRNTSQLAEASAVAFMTQYGWIKPYIEVGAGWLWTKSAGVRDNAAAGRLGTGAEFQVATALVLRPYVNYTSSGVLPSDHRWNYGVKANYWLTDQWGVSAGLDRDNQQNMGYSAGLNYRF